MRTNFANLLTPALLIGAVMCCFFLSAQDTAMYKYYFNVVKSDEPKNELILHDFGINCNYDSVKISIKGDTMLVIRTILKYYDLRNKQYEALKNVAGNINSKQFNKYLKAYVTLRDSVIK